MFPAWTQMGMSLYASPNRNPNCEFMACLAIAYICLDSKEVLSFLRPPVQAALESSSLGGELV
jgi:hypothetical protein